MPRTSETGNPKKKRRKQSSGSSNKGKGQHALTLTADAKPVAQTKVTIQVQKPNATTDPILVSFPGGIPEQNKRAPPPKFIWRQLNPKAKLGRAIEGQDGSGGKGACVYRATSLGLGYDDRRTKMCVGIYDKQTGILKLHQAAARGTVFSLQQHLPSYKEEEKLEEDEQNLNLSRSLFTDFGSAKKRKVLKSQQDNKVNVDAVIGAGSVIADSMLDDSNDDDDNNDSSNNNNKDGSKKHQMSESNRKAVEQARRMTADDAKSPGYRNASSSIIESAHAQARSAMLPAYNLQATEVYDAYPLHTMLGQEGWDFISRMVEACLRNKEETDFASAVTRGKPGEDGTVPPPERRGWVPSVLDCLQKVENNGTTERALDETLDDGASPTSAKYQLRCIIVYHYLVKFYCAFHKDAHHRGGRIVPGMEEDQPKFRGIPRDAALHMFDEFATQQMSDRPAPILPPEQREGQRPRREINPNLPRYIMSKPNANKILTHIMLVYLMARGGSKMKVDDMTKLLDDLTLDPKEASSMLRMAGCTVAIPASTKKMRAWLTVPLTFLKPNRGGRK